MNDYNWKFLFFGSLNSVFISLTFRLLTVLGLVYFIHFVYHSLQTQQLNQLKFRIIQKKKTLRK